MTKAFYKIAQDFALKQSYGSMVFDLIRFAGKKDGYEFYRFLSSKTIGHYLGMPRYVKINKQGHAFEVLNQEDVFWAHHQEIVLNNF